MNRLVVACFTHWYTSLLYVAPVLLIGAVLGAQAMRDRRRDGAGRGPEQPPTTPTTTVQH